MRRFAAYVLPPFLQNFRPQIKKAKKKLLKVAVKYEGPVEAPIKKDQKIATLRVV